MSPRKLVRVLRKLPKQITKRFVTYLLRNLLLWNRRPAAATAGFVLPTTILLLLMVALTAGALTYRAYSRSEQAIVERQQQVIINAATPAVDRAKAKIEYLFREDNRITAGLPSSAYLNSMMLNNGDPVSSFPGIGVGETPYRLPDEIALNINGPEADSNLEPAPDEIDNAWAFNADVNGDGVVDEDNEWIIYSILITDKARDDDDDVLVSVGDSDLQEKADNLVTRTGPLETSDASSQCAAALASAATASSLDPGEGWQVVGFGDSAALQKNFQVDVYVVDLNDVSRSIQTLEFQQSRQSISGNKWGAWFRYDMDVYPGEEFNWNGAMHTEGNLFVSADLQAHMISSHNSCLYSKDASEIEIRNDDDYNGQVIAGSIKGNVFGTSGVKVHVFTNQTTAPSLNNFAAGNDSVNPGAGALPIQIATDPIALFTEGRHQHVDDSTWTEVFDSQAMARFEKGESFIPNVDDAFRADNRWGPQPTYGSDFDIADYSGTNVGDEIDTATNSELVSLVDPAEGLDGYWERRAIATGMRLIVGQRLELGNPAGWNYTYNTSQQLVYQADKDPLYPIAELNALSVDTSGSSDNSSGTNTVGVNERWQHKSLGDNLAAVQGMVVYHYETESGDFPLACIALTAHPGTPQTVINSRQFDLYPESSALKADFFSGYGTNGWEFGFNGITTDAGFGSAIGSASDLGKALRNLAYFAGDPNGGAPSFTPVQDSDIHPYPQMAMWGDFSPLRKVLDSGVSYGSLSPADKSTLHSAACTLELLAYNINSLKGEYDAVVATTGTDGLADVATALTGLVTSGAVSTPTTATADQWSKALEASAASATVKERAKILAQYRQIERDRDLGFITGKTLDFANPGGTIPAYAAASFELTCDPSTEFSSVTDPDAQISLGLAFCSAAHPPKYPSLFYVFPNFDHDQDGSGASVAFTTTQPATEEYIEQVVTDYGETNSFGAVTVSNIAATPRGISSGSLTYAGWTLPTESGTALTDPDALDQAFSINGDDGSGGYDGRTISLIDKGLYDGRELLSVRVLDVNLELLSQNTNPDGTDYWLTDDAERSGRGIVYAFREDAVREDEIIRPTGTTWGNCDQLSELPATTACFMSMPKASTSFVGQDPPLNDSNLISAKPVDFYADPERRPHGFRLRNGVDISDALDRQSGLTFVTDNSVYIQGDFNLHSSDGTRSGLLEEFASPQTLLNGGVGFGAPFYNGRTIDKRNVDNFANPDVDYWRPVEILADAVTILSDNFKDGSVEDFFTLYSPGMGAIERGEYAAATSYTNANRFYFEDTNQARFAADRWAREVPASAPLGEISSPIWVGRNAEFALSDGATALDVGFDGEGTGAANNAAILMNFDHGRLSRFRQNNQIGAADTYVYALIISGIVPMRAGQAYGGLHNFPRLLEYWNEAPTGGATTKRTLYLYGSLFQLSFSRAATAPFDQDRWEPSTTAPDTSLERNVAYGAPERNWGYDVAQLYVPPGPISSRFVDSPAPRSEFYRELPADDPYILNLRCAKAAGESTAFLDEQRTVNGPNVCPR
ncbi:hormogonium polysaccharide biosynthesis protein HpsA [Almyronema epifaneia]|uniref:Hormogonium polysaccharide biosynthesis protein HpsA n=1 Tax=Almyronema epifaneia S1 TaxID=2991925 RepID=A0ABW6IGQ4_9CYAN